MTATPLGAPIAVSLVSHTNVGKTSLLRTLLRRDIGEVADRPHVTEVAEGFALLETPAGDVLRLWDTPGFGDSTRLYRRLAATAHPIGWFQSQVWDRFVDRPFFSSQQAVRNVKAESDVVLYLVNAAEDPASAAYVDAELRILGWIGKPVLVLLNQTGPARVHGADAADEARWREYLGAHVGKYEVLALDAFARCWVQEDRLLGQVATLVPTEKREAFARLRAAWRKRNLDVFDAAIHGIAAHLAAMACDREALGDDAMVTLGQRHEARVRAETDRLIALHGLSGAAAARNLALLAVQFDVARPADATRTSVIGGVLSGALGGLAADLSTGGLSLGAGALIGAVLGAFGGTGVARAYNAFTGIDEGKVRWSAEGLTQEAHRVVARYLAVAHFGRGRGTWVEGAPPPQWQGVVAGILEPRRAALASLWTEAQSGTKPEDLAGRLQPLVSSACREALLQLHPGSGDLWPAADRPA